MKHMAGRERPCGLNIVTDCCCCYFSFYENLEEHAYVDVPVLEKRKKDTITLKQKTINYKNQIKGFEVRTVILFILLYEMYSSFKSIN